MRVTGSPGIKDDLVNAGAIWEDAPVVIDRHFVSSRKPDDLPAFCRGILQVLGANCRTYLFPFAVSALAFFKIELASFSVSLSSDIARVYSGLRLG